jgi:glutamyl-tRNA(Gln) amidotransferase subunit E
MFGFEPYSGIRLGKEIGHLVRFFGIGGVFHSDELPNYGINVTNVDKVKKYLKLVGEDGFLIIAGEDLKLDYAISSIIKRLQDATKGVPAETRAATQDGETIFLRPRPGASRMYPETDIPSISVLPEEIKLVRKNIPKSWDDSIAEIQEKYNLNFQLSEQIFDSEHMDIFEKICKNKKNSPNFVASILCSTLTNLERKGFDGALLKSEHIIESFELLASNKIPKESVEIIFESIMSGKSDTVSTAIQSTAITSISEGELNVILDEIIQKNTELVKELGENVITTLMGIAMKQVRGKVSGQTVNDLLRKKIQNYE